MAVYRDHVFKRRGRCPLHAEAGMGLCSQPVGVFPTGTFGVASFPFKMLQLLIFPSRFCRSPRCFEGEGLLQRHGPAARHRLHDFLGGVRHLQELSALSEPGTRSRRRSQYQDGCLPVRSGGGGSPGTGHRLRCALLCLECKIKSGYCPPNRYQ